MHNGHLHPLESTPINLNQCLEPIRLYKFRQYFPVNSTTDLSLTVQDKIGTRLF